MLADERPGSPSPTLVEEYAKDPDVDIDWAGISVLHTCNDGEPSTLRTPCESFNNNNICLCPSTCPYPHVCSACFQADHCALACPGKIEQHAPPRRNKKGYMWDENVSYSPCAQGSLDAAPLPRPPPPSELPPDLVRVVRDHPELFKIVTPIKIDILEGLLATHPNQEFVRSVIIGLREGFWPCAGLPNILVNESRRQRRHHGPKQTFLEKYVEEEIKSYRFSRSFGRKLFPGMACMPVHVAQNQDKNKFRLIYDHSAGHYSLNSLIPESERSAQVDRIDALIRVLRTRQLDLANVVLFKSDVSHAFRIIPMSPYWQALQAVNINGLYYIDRCNTFGNAASQRLFCAFYSLVLWIAENIWRLTDILSYVDDNFSWELSSRMKYYRPYDKRLPEKQTRLLEIWDLLGIPHAHEKQEFKSVLTIIGFQVNLRQMRVTVSDERMERFVKHLLEFCSGSTAMASLQDCRRLAGSINWTFEVNPLLRPGIASLHEEMKKVNQSDNNAQVAITKRVVSDLMWLATLLQKSKGVHFTRPCLWRPDDALQTAYIHASTEGFGIWFPSVKQGFYHQYPVPAQDSLVSVIHTFVMVCAIYRATKTWRKGVEGRPGRLVVFTCDRSTVDMFDMLRAPDGLHHVLLLAMELLAKGDMDYLVSQAGNNDDFTIAARLSRESKESLDQDYPDIVIREFIIPPQLAIRAKWDTAHAKRHVSSRLAPAGIDSQTSDATGGRKGRKYVSTHGRTALLKKSGQSKSGFLRSFWNGGRKLTKNLTYGFR